MIYVIAEMPATPSEATVNNNGRGEGGVVWDHLHIIVKRYILQDPVDVGFECQAKALIAEVKSRPQCLEHAIEEKMQFWTTLANVELFNQVLSELWLSGAASPFTG